MLEPCGHKAVSTCRTISKLHLGSMGLSSMLCVILDQLREPQPDISARICCQTPADGYEVSLGGQLSVICFEPVFKQII